MDSRKFEDSFKDAFEGAEISPSENVWTNIELDLEKADGSKVKRRLLLYKMLAAASLTFALGFAGIGYYVVMDQNQRLIASNSTDAINEKASEPQLIPSTTDNIGLDGPTISRGGDNQDQKSTDRSLTSVDNNGSGNSGLSTIGEVDSTYRFDAAVNSENGFTSPQRNRFSEHELFSETSTSDRVARQLPEFYTLKDPELNLDQQLPDPGALLLAKLAREEMEYAAIDKKEARDKSERLWTSVGFAAGGFSAVNSSVSTPTANSFLYTNSSTVPDKQAKASGVAYSVGINVGAKLSKRWVLLGGVNYLTQSSDYVATNVVGDNNFGALKAESINELDKIQTAGSNASSRLAPTFPYSVNNNVQFFSLPLQAGYLVVNKKFGLQVNAGVSTDLFLQNTITPEGVSLDKVTQGSGTDSPYRSVNFSGLMGTELSYRFGQRYRIALNPGLRYPLNSVYKSDIGIQSTPLTFDVGLRVRYIFH